MKKSNVKKLAYLLSLSLSLTGCSNLNSSSMLVNNITIEKLQEQIKNESIDEISKKYYEYFDSLEYKYNHQSNYLTEEEINELITINENIKECTYVFDGDIDSIIEKIKVNSNNNSFFTKENIELLKRVLKRVYKNGKSNIDEDFHKLSTIRVAYGDGDNVGVVENSDIHYVAYFDEETNTLYLDREYIKDIASQEVVAISYYLEYVMDHECGHVRQVLCDCNEDIRNKKLSYGHYFTFMLESSAESSIYNELNRIFKLYYTYDEEREAEREILLLGLFNNKSIDDYYASIYNTDLKGLFNYLDLSDDEIEDFYNIIYAIDGTMCRNELPYEIFDNVEDVTYGELKREIGYAYKLNLFKMVIKRLIDYTSNNNISLKDNLTIYYLIKNIIFENMYYFEESDDEIYKVYPEEIEEMIKMDEMYIEYLQEKYNKSIEDIREIESIDAYIGSYSIINYANTGEYVYSNCKKQTKHLITLFPTLVNIINNNTDINLNNYNNALNSLNNDKKRSLK